MVLIINNSLKYELVKKISKKEEFEENQEWYNNNTKELKKTHGGSFIAIDKKEVVDSSSDFDKLFNKFKEKLSKVFIVYVPKEGEVTYW